MPRGRTSPKGTTHESARCIINSILEILEQTKQIREAGHQSAGGLGSVATTRAAGDFLGRWRCLASLIWTASKWAYSLCAKMR